MSNTKVQYLSAHGARTRFGGGTTPPAGTVNLLSQKITKSKISLKKISTSYSHAKTPNLQKIFDSESMTLGGKGGYPLPPRRYRKFTKSKNY